MPASAVAGIIESANRPVLMGISLAVAPCRTALVLATVVSAPRTRFDDTWRRRINIGSALVLAGFALWQVVAVRSLL